MKEKPRDLTEEEVKAASKGLSEEVFGKKKPISLTEDEVKAASEGRSKEVIEKKLEESSEQEK